MGTVVVVVVVVVVVAVVVVVEGGLGWGWGVAMCGRCSVGQAARGARGGREAGKARGLPRVRRFHSRGCLCQGTRLTRGSNIRGNRIRGNNSNSQGSNSNSSSNIQGSNREDIPVTHHKACLVCRHTGV